MFSPHSVGSWAGWQVKQGNRLKVVWLDGVAGMVLML